jgi:hypothetical protein
LQSFRYILQRNKLCQPNADAEGEHEKSFIVIAGNGTISASTNPTPTFTSVTTTDLNVKNVTFTGTGAVTITSGNDLNFVAAGNVTLNGEPTISLTRLKSVLAASADFADFKSRIASL